MTKNFLKFNLLSLSIICLTACGGNNNAAQNQPKSELGTSATDDKFVVATTFTVIADIAQNVAGDKAEVVSIAKAGAEIHDYEPTPQDIARVQEADLILYNGLSLERWFEKFYGNGNAVPSAIVTEGIAPLPIKEGAHQDFPNPHAWMSPTNGLIYVENIKNALIKADPANAEVYTQNAQNYAQKIKDLDAPLREKLAQIPESQRWLVTTEGAFSYMAKDYGLNEVYIWAVNAEQQGTPQQVKRVIDAVRTNNIPVVFSESTISDKPMQQIVKETGTKYGGVLYVDSLSESGGKVPTYLDLLNVTVSTVVEGFESSK